MPHLRPAAEAAARVVMEPDRAAETVVALVGLDQAVELAVAPVEAARAAALAEPDQVGPELDPGVVDEPAPAAKAESNK